MIVKEKNWNTKGREEFKNVLVSDLFDKIGVVLKHKVKQGEQISNDEALLDKMSQKVDDYFFNLVGSASVYSNLLPSRLKDANKFYIFTVTALSTGGVLLSFVAKLGGDIDPVVLDLIY